MITSFEFQLHPVGTILGGPIFYDIDQTEDVMHFYRDYMRSAPIEMTAFFGFHQAPPAPFMPEHLHTKPVAAIVTCYSGELEQGEPVIRPLREFGPPLLDLVGPMPYPAINAMFDDLYPPGLQHYWKADFVPELTDEAIKVHVEHGPKVPSLLSGMHLYPQTGAIQQVGQHETAYSHRDVEFIHNILAVDPDPAQMDGNIAWMQSYYQALRPHSDAGSYVNFLMADEGQERVKATYRDNYDRLVEIKNRYDPHNLFRVNQNIKPSNDTTLV